jgi:hypothetical protein
MRKWGSKTEKKALKAPRVPMNKTDFVHQIQLFDIFNNSYSLIINFSIDYYVTEFMLHYYMIRLLLFKSDKVQLV